MFCYRRHGHNEGDEPSFTQPMMYRKISSHPTTRQIYAKKLVEEGTLKAGDGDAMVTDFRKFLEEEFEAATSYKPNKADWLEGRWSGIAHRPVGPASRCHGGTEGGADRDWQGPDPDPGRFQRPSDREAPDAGQGEDVRDRGGLRLGDGGGAGLRHPADGKGAGAPLRAGSGRGTFSQRHSVLVDQQTEDRYLPLNNIAEDQAPYEVVDSMLSEMAVLGFEYGFSLAEPNALVLWEAQFGDFANGAQVIVDQFLSTAELKWLRMSGLVMLLPHGLEGQGPEHSSARLERYLQLCAEDNMQVANVTTPANYFHILRRQIHRDFRKPLILMTPKSLLRHKACVSTIDDMATGSSFHRVLYEDNPPCSRKDTRKLILCSGKVYYDLVEKREELGVKDVQVMRVEQLYPYPTEPLVEELEGFRDVEKVIWCQEEPKNMGAWFFVQNWLEECFRLADMKNVSRPELHWPSAVGLTCDGPEQDPCEGAGHTVPQGVDGNPGRRHEPREITDCTCARGAPDDR